MAVEKLTARRVLAAGLNDNGKAKDHTDAQTPGLRLRCKPGKNGAVTASWIFRYTHGDRTREMGLGACDRRDSASATASLEKARDGATDASRRVRAGEDPLGEKNTTPKPADGRITLLQYARDYHAKHIANTRSAKHAKQWLGSIERLLSKDLLDRPVAAITAAEVLAEMVPIYRRIPESAGRVFQRLAVILSDAMIEGVRADNAASPRVQRAMVTRAGMGERQRGHHASLAWRDVPEFFTRLRAQAGVGARCLEFVILTACRTGEALGATWAEIDFETRSWSIPAERMKMRRPHTVPLSDRAVEILESLRGLHETWIFPTPIKPCDSPLSTNSMDSVIDRMGHGGAERTREPATTHGMRASFRTWVADTRPADAPAAELALAHVEGNKVVAAYNRSLLLPERRALLAAWAMHCTGAVPRDVETEKAETAEAV